MGKVAEALMDDPRFAIGGNNPPEPTPFDLSEAEINGLYDEASNWLDGEPIETQQVADKIAKLMSDIRAAVKRADDRRKEENKPFDDGKAAVQAKYNPLIQKDRGKADLALQVCKSALSPFLETQEAAKRAKEEAARKEADRLAAEAQAAIRSAKESDLATRAKAEDMLRDAKRADGDARRAEKDRAGAKGGARAVTFRTSYDAEITDMTAFARHAWINYRQEVDEFFAALSTRKVNAGNHAIPGVTVHEIRSVV